MDCLTIGTSEEAANIKDKITALLPQEYKSKIIFKYNDKRLDKHSLKFIDLFFKEQADSHIKSHLADIITECIIEKYESKIVSKIITSNYSYFNSFEKNEILKKAMSKAKNCTKVNELFENSRKNIIKRRVKEYLETSNKLFLEGFVRFRLKDYWQELEEIVDESVEDFLVDREYQEFIKLLKYFVEIQEPKEDFIHILTHENGTHDFFDKNSNNITDECTEDFKKEIISNEINYDDLLISTLIVLSPKQILWHNLHFVNNLELVETVKKVFSEKLNVCEGCSFCS